MNKFLELPTVFLVTAVLVICGCTPTATEETPQIAGASISTLSPLTPTSMPSTPTNKIETTIIGLPTGPGVEWDLVVIGDSTLWKLAEAFATQIEKDVGVKVLAHDITPGGLSAGKVLRSLHRGDTLTDLPERLREAEVVVMFVNPTESIDPDIPLDIGACLYNQAPKNCSMESFGKYIDDLKGIWEEIIILREGQPTVLRATDIYNPVVANWQKTGVFEACTECWVNQSEATRIAAEAYNIPFLSRYDVLNGPDHLGYLKDMGYVSSDGIHPSKLMAEYTAQLLSQMGYAPVTPP